MRRWTKLILDHPWLIIGIAAAITILAGSLLPRITFEASIDAMIPDDDPVLRELAQVVEDFGTQDLFFIAVQAEDVFAPEVLGKIDALAQELESLVGVAGVQTPLNAQKVESSFFGLEIGPMTQDVPHSAAEIEQFKTDILSSPYAGRLITADGRGAALLLELENGTLDRNTLMGQIEELVERYRDPETIHVVGDAYILYFTEQAMKSDLVKLVPFVVVIIGLVLYLTLRSLLGIIIPLITVGASVIWTVGIMIWQGIPVSIISMAMPVILVTIGIASSIHILTKYQEALAEGLPKREALEETFRTITSPVLMAALTTAAGFASLITAFVQPIREFGVLTAIGVLLAMALSLGLVPALLILVQEPKVKLADSTRKDGPLTRILKALTGWAVDYPKRLAAVVGVILVVFALGATRITLESNIVNYFGSSSPVKQATMVIEEVFGGSMQISVVVDTGQEDGVKDPAVLQELVAISSYLNSWETINHATSIADVIRELNQALWDGDPEAYVIPETREAVAQQLLLFSMQGGSGLDSLVTYDYSRALVTAQMKTLDAEEMARTMAEVESYLAERYRGSGLTVHLTGTPKVMMRLMNRYVQTQISSLVSSSLMVGLIVALLMKSVVLGLFSLIPLIFTVLINFGIMGFTGLPLDAVTSIISSVAIGIGVDYAIHYISRYRLEAAAGHDTVTALRRTGTSAGRAIVFNALALIIGFLVLAFSQFRAIAVFGYLVSATMIVSSLAALLVIPLLLKLYAQRQLERGKGMKRTLLIVLALLLTASAGISARELTGEEILDQLKFNTILTGSGRAQLTMITENAKGAQRSYSLEIFLKMGEDGDAQFLEYLAPADVRGTKFLSLNPKEGENQMWLYLPALGRERRIAAHMTGDSFMGTDFTYEEIGGSFDYQDDYGVKRLADQVEQGVDCYLLELTAKGDQALYEKVQLWVWQAELVPVKIEFYRGGQLAKTLTLSEFKQISGELIPHEVVMADNVQGTKTILQITEVSQEEVADEIFTVRNLRR